MFYVWMTPDRVITILTPADGSQQLYFFASLRILESMTSLGFRMSTGSSQLKPWVWGLFLSDCWPSSSIMPFISMRWRKLFLVFRLCGFSLNVKQFFSNPKPKFWCHILCGCSVYNWGIHYHRCRTREDCDGWWFSSCCSSVAQHWQLKYLVPFSANIAWLFLFSPHNNLLQFLAWA